MAKRNCLFREIYLCKNELEANVYQMHIHREVVDCNASLLHTKCTVVHGGGRSILMIQACFWEVLWCFETRVTIRTHIESP